MQKTDISKLDYLIITILSQLKIFYLGLLFGIALFKFIKKERKELITSLFFIILNSFIFIYDSITNIRSSYRHEIFGVPYWLVGVYMHGALSLREAMRYFVYRKG